MVPQGLMTIEAEAFAGTNATIIIIPISVDTIESRAFAHCTGLQLLYYAGSPFSISSDLLEGCENVTVSVVKGSSAEKLAIRYGHAVNYH